MTTRAPEILDDATTEAGYVDVTQEEVERAIGKIIAARSCTDETERKKCFESGCIDDWIYISYCINGQCKHWKKKYCGPPSPEDSYK